MAALRSLQSRQLLFEPLEPKVVLSGYNLVLDDLVPTRLTADDAAEGGGDEVVVVGNLVSKDSIQTFIATPSDEKYFWLQPRQHLGADVPLVNIPKEGKYTGNLWLVEDDDFGGFNPVKVIGEIIETVFTCGTAFWTGPAGIAACGKSAGDLVNGVIGAPAQRGKELLGAIQFEVNVNSGGAHLSAEGLTTANTGYQTGSSVTFKATGADASYDGRIKLEAATGKSADCGGKCRSQLAGGPTLYSGP